METATHKKRLSTYITSREVRRIEGQQIENLFAGNIRQRLMDANLDYHKLYEIRLRVGRPLFLTYDGGVGAKAYRVNSKEELRPVLEEAMALGAPVVFDCQINCDDKVYPMVSPGAPISDAFDDTDLKIN